MPGSQNKPAAGWLFPCMRVSLQGLAPVMPCSAAVHKNRNPAPIFCCIFIRTRFIITPSAARAILPTKAGNHVDKEVSQGRPGLLGRIGHFSDYTVAQKTTDAKYCHGSRRRSGDELAGIEEKALQSGASRSSSRTCAGSSSPSTFFPPCVPAPSTKEVFARHSLARPVIAKRQIEIAHRAGADAVAHGCTGQRQRPGALRADVQGPDPSMPVIAPWRVEPPLPGGRHQQPQPTTFPSPSPKRNPIAWTATCGTSATKAAS